MGRAFRTVPGKTWAAPLVWAACLGMAAATSQAGLPSDVTVQASTRSLVLFEYHPVLPSIVPLDADNDYAVVSLAGAEPTGPPGAPALPAKHLTFAVPHGADVDLRLLRTGRASLGTHRVAPVPRWEHTDGGPRLGMPRFEENPTLYGIQPSLPAQPARIVLDSVFRGQRIVVVELVPFRYEPGSGSLEFLGPLSVALEFSGGLPGDPLTRPDAHEAWFRDHVVNYEEAREWRRYGARPGKRKATVGFETGTEWVKLGITGKAMYRVTGEMLADGGLDISSVDPDSIRVFSGGGRPLPAQLDYDRINGGWMTECAVWVHDGGEGGVLDGEDYVVFYGLGAQGFASDYDGRLDEDDWWRNVYTDTNVYWLATGGAFGSAPRRMESRGAGWLEPGPSQVTNSRQWVRFEENTLPNFEIDYEDGWMWMNFGNGPASSKLVKITLRDVDDSHRARLRVRLTGQRISGSTHQATVSLAGEVLDTVTWVSDGYADVDTTAEVADGDNYVHVQVTTSDVPAVAEVALAWIQVQYWRALRLEDQIALRSPDTTGVVEYVIDLEGTGQVDVFDVTDHFSPVRLDSVRVAGTTASVRDSLLADSTFRYVAVSEWREPAYVRVDRRSDLRTRTERVDLVILHHPKLAGPAQTLAEHRQRDWHVRMVDIEDVYDEFAWGLFDPVAIRDFLAYARDNYEDGGPGYVLLFGDASYYYLADYPASVRNYVPSWFAWHERGSGYNYSTDDWYGYLNPADSLMQVAIGRIPVQTVAGAQAVVDKILAYENAPVYGPWRARAVVAADDLGKLDTFSPCEIFHTVDADSLAESYMARALTKRKIYLTDYEYEPDTWLKRDAQTDFRAALDEGALITLYIGHGDAQKLADEVLYIWEASSRAPANVGRPTFFLAGSCEVGNFSQPVGSSMGEELLRLPQSGAVAVFSSTYLAYGPYNYRLLRALFASLFPDQALSDRPLGGAVLSAKNQLRTAGLESGQRMHNERLELLGDPTLTLASPALAVDLSVGSSDTVRFVRRDTVSIRGTVVDAGAPATGFTGTAWISAYGTADTTGHWTVNHLGQPLYGCGRREIDYNLEGRLVYKGQAEVEDGQFETTFFVPWDADEGSLGRLSVYVAGPGGDGLGGIDSIGVGGMAGTEDDTGPDLSVTEDGVSIHDGSRIPPEGTLRICFEDESGINIDSNSNATAAVLIVDSEESQDPRLRCEYESGSFTRACAEVPYTLQPGSHSLWIRAYDNMGNGREVTLAVSVAGDEDLRISDVVCYPNPFGGEAYLIYDINREADVTIRIFTVAGRPVRKMETGLQLSGQQQVYWDGRDEDGDPVANGAYLFKVDARSGGEHASALGRAVRIK